MIDVTPRANGFKMMVDETPQQTIPVDETRMADDVGLCRERRLDPGHRDASSDRSGLGYSAERRRFGGPSLPDARDE